MPSSRHSFIYFGRWFLHVRLHHKMHGQRTKTHRSETTGHNLGVVSPMNSVRHLPMMEAILFYAKTDKRTKIRHHRGYEAQTLATVSATSRMCLASAANVQTDFQTQVETPNNPFRQSLTPGPPESPYELLMCN
eukprot:GHVQ01015537.1.p1 GENE.GHVQ01015537.1~~GHVQ01015537.1.p1  ORF type:complete len:134 (-),score=4.96 GHVQ01015537.1:139-540(-)